LHDGDVVIAGNDDDELFGDNGNDVLAGGAGWDFLAGGEGSDRLNGGPGDDYLEGGSNADRFEFEFNWGDDEIDDFEDGTDLIGLSGIDWTELAFSVLSGDGVLLTHGNNSILVYGAQLGDFSQDDFYNFIPT
jgi:Ca2+-binding RTX toxin-like protein